MKQPTVLFVGANEHSPTDGIIARGIRKLLEDAIGDYEYDHVEIDDFNLMPDEALRADQKYDYLIQCGNPQLWHSFWRTPKYHNLMRFRRAHLEARHVLLGIGECMNISDINTGLLRRPKELAFVRALCEGAATIVRSSISEEILTEARVEHERLPCPGYWAVEPTKFKQPFGPAMVWYDPRTGVSRDDWKSQEKFRAYARIFLEYYKAHKPYVFCAFPSDIPGAVEIGLPKPIVLQSHNHTAEVAKYHRKLLSGRVHCAIPAYASNVDVTLVAVDSRAQTFADIGGDVVSVEPGIVRRLKPDFETAHSAYTRILRNV